MTASDVPAATTGAFDDTLSLSTSTGDDGAVTVSAAGDVDGYTAPLLRAVLDGHLARGCPALVVDLSGVEFLGSAGLATLVQAQKSATDRGIDLRLIATTRAVLRVLEVTGLIDLFAISGVQDPPGDS